MYNTNLSVLRPSLFAARAASEFGANELDVAAGRCDRGCLAGGASEESETAL
jgi:hypothetical protein